MLYVEALAAPDTINTMPEKTLHAFADHGKVKGAMPVDGGDAEAVLARVHARPASTTRRSPPSSSAKAPQSFDKSWSDLHGLHRRRRAQAPAKADRTRERSAITTAHAAGQAQPLTQRPAWKALAAHRADDARPASARALRRAIPRAASA